MLQQRSWNLGSTSQAELYQPAPCALGPTHQRVVGMPRAAASHTGHGHGLMPICWHVHTFFTCTSYTHQ